MSVTRESIELWLQSPSLPNLEVSNQGRVRVYHSSKPANIGRILNQRNDKDGYLMITVDTPTVKKTTRRVHRLVAEAFIPNPNKNEVVHHKDNVKDNNDASNLEWTTISFNTKHAYHIEAIRSPTAKYVKASIDGEVFSYYDSCFKCAKAFGLGRDPIEKCVSTGNPLFDFIKIEEVDLIPEDAVVGKVLTNKVIRRRINPHRIIYNNGDEMVIESALELAHKMSRDRTTAYRILKGEGWGLHEVKTIKPITKEEYYRLHINW